MSTNFGSERLVVGAHYGMRDWLSQRVGVRLALQVFTIVWLAACAGWAVQVLWRL